MPFHLRSKPARLNTRQTLDGLTAAMVGVEHHERQPPVALQRMLAIKVENGLLFPLLEPEIPENPTVVLVDAAVASAPGIELAGRDAEPLDETPGMDPGLLGPAPHEIDDLVGARRVVSRFWLEFPKAFF